MCRVLDLRGRSFARLTDAGFTEISRLCPQVVAVFLAANTKVTTVGLDAFRCHGARCLALGCEIARDALLELLLQYKQSHRLDLRDPKFSQLTAKGLAEIYELCPECEAIFTNPRCKINQQAMVKLSTEHPSVRCVVLGREISPDTYSQMETQLKEKRVLDLTGDQFDLLSDAGIAELIRMPGLKDTLEAIFTDPSKVTEAAVLSLKEECGDQCKCVLLGREMTLESYHSLERQYSETHQLDLAKLPRAQYARLTNSGLSEFELLFSKTNLVFLPTPPTAWTLSFWNGDKASGSPETVITQQPMGELALSVDDTSAHVTLDGTKWDRVKDGTALKLDHISSSSNSTCVTAIVRFSRYSGRVSNRRLGVAAASNPSLF
eukprot:COSAG06_NODE_12964_length_1308_cov_0.797353_1_plen_376_part_10